MDIKVRNGRDCQGASVDRVSYVVGAIHSNRLCDSDPYVVWAGDWKGALTVVYSSRPTDFMVRAQIKAWGEMCECQCGVAWLGFERVIGGKLRAAILSPTKEDLSQFASDFGGWNDGDLDRAAHDLGIPEQTKVQDWM